MKHMRKTCECQANDAPFEISHSAVIVAGIFLIFTLLLPAKPSAHTPNNNNRMAYSRKIRFATNKNFISYAKVQKCNNNSEHTHTHHRGDAEYSENISNDVQHGMNVGMKRREGRDEEKYALLILIRYK